MLVAVIIAASLVLLWSVRNIGMGHKRMPAPAESLVGSYGTLRTKVAPGLVGKVEVHGTLWNAEAFEPLAEGARVMVVAHDNLTLTVSTVE